MKPIVAFSMMIINKLIYNAFGMKFIANGIQWGDGTVEGDWKLVRVDNDIIRYRLESLVWVDKGAFLA